MHDREVELKFMLPRDGVADVAAHPLLRGAVAKDARALASTYFDTQDEDLRNAGFACRIRAGAGREVQTVKGPTAEAAVRQEWEFEAATPDLSRVPLPRGLRKAVARKVLQPVFQVNVERQTWTLDWRASLIEAACDVGCIVADARSAEICEFELELKEGDARDLFDLARQLCADLPLDLDLRSKAQRGWLLTTDDKVAAPDEGAPAIPPDASFIDGFTRLAQVCVEAVATQTAAFRAQRDADALHEARTAVRRLRSVLRVFRRHVRDDAYDDLWAELKRISRALGDARDLDVAGERLDIRAALAPRRDAAYARVLDALATPRHRRLMLDLAAWLSTGDWRARKPRKPARGAFADVAALEFHRWDKRIRKAANSFAELDADERHELRLRAKSLAYCCELTAGLAPRGARKDHARYLKSLKRLQSALGDLNDARVSDALLEDIGSDSARQALRRAARRNKRKRKADEDHARKALGRFLEAQAPFGAD